MAISEHNVAGFRTVLTIGEDLTLQFGLWRDCGHWGRYSNNRVHHAAVHGRDWVGKDNLLRLRGLGDNSRSHLRDGLLWNEILLNWHGTGSHIVDCSSYLRR